MSNPKALQELICYLPRALVSEVNERPFLRSEAEMKSSEMAVLFADISGFTALVEKYSGAGARGTETFTSMLNDYFGRVISLISEWGGDVEKIAGDAVVAYWSVPESRDIKLPGVTLQATRCAQAIQTQLDQFEYSDDVRLSMRIAIVAGGINILQIGGVEERWQYLLAGYPLLEIDKILHNGEPGDIVLSAGAWSQVSELCEGQTLDDRSVLLSSAGASSGRTALLPLTPSLEAYEALSGYVPRSLRKRLAANQHEWLGEMRSVNVLFVSLEGLVCNSPSDLQSIQQAIAAIQRILYRYGGSLRQFTMDDKGPLVMALFGLPLHTHEDDAARCVMAALDIHSELDSVQINCKCGVTMGNAFCGVVGNSERREFMAIANAVNVAARFMTSTNSVACDQATVKAAGDRLVFETLPPLNLKGQSTPVPAFRPLHSSSKSTPVRGKLVGRDQELAQIKSALDQLDVSTIHSPVMIIGEPGMGKSTLIEHACWIARENNQFLIRSSCSSIDAEAPYLLWRPVFSAMLGFDDQPPEEALEKLYAKLQPGREEWVPLLNTVLPIELEESVITAEMRGEVRARNTRALLRELLIQQAGTAPTVIVLDDCHWADASSWSLLLEACCIKGHMQVLAAMRPIDKGDSLYSLPPSGLEISLTELGHDEIYDLLCYTFDVIELPTGLAEAVERHAGGNAFFCQELGLALREYGVIEVENRQCRVTGDLDQFEFPSTVEKTINGRVDTLTPELQLTLKVASVIGRVFGLQSLARIHPIEADRPQLSDYLDTLANLEFTPLLSPPPEQRNKFRHAITQEVLYAQLLFSQRCQLHKTLAEWLEIKHAGDITQYFGTLAYHWKCAENAQNARTYFVKAGEAALHAGAYPEAISLLEEALLCDDQSDSKLEGKDRARLNRMLGEAKISTGDLRSARTALERGLTTIGRPWPASLALPLLRECGLQFLHRIGLKPGAQSPELDREESRLLEYLGHVFYFTEEGGANVLSNIRGLNRLERLGPSASLASSYMQVAVILSVIGLTGLMKKYRLRARSSFPTDANYAQRILFYNYSSLISVPQAEWTTAHQLMQEWRDLCERIDDRHMLCFNLSINSILAFLQGDLPACRRWREQLNVMVGDNEMQIQCWAKTEWAELQEAEGDSPEAILTLQNALPLLAERGATEKIWMRGILARVLWMEGRNEEAMEQAGKALELGTSSPPTGFYALEGYAGIAETYLGLLTNNRTDKVLAAQSGKAIKLFNSFSRLFPVAGPRAMVLKARFEGIKGRDQKARKAFSSAVGLAKSLAMPLEQARAMHWLAVSGLETNLSVDNLAQAQALYSQCGATMPDYPGQNSSP